MTDAVRPDGMRPDGLTTRPESATGGDDRGDASGPRYASRSPYQSTYLPDAEDGTGPVAAVGFGAWRATVAAARERREALEARTPAGQAPAGRAGVVALAGTAQPPLGYLPPGGSDSGPTRVGPPAPVCPQVPADVHDPDAVALDQPASPRAAAVATEPAPPYPLADAPAPPAAHRPPSASDAGTDAVDLLDSLAEVVFRTDAEGRWTYLNPAWTRLTGFGIAESLGKAFLDYVHPDEVEHTVALFTAVVVGGADHCHHETRYRTADGTYRRVQIRAKVLRADDGANVVGNMGTIIDVTESRIGAEMATEHGALLELLPTGGKIDDLPVGVVIYEPDLVVRRASRVVDRLVASRMKVGDSLDVLDRQLRPTHPGGQGLGGEWGLVATAQRTHQAQVADLDVVPGGYPRVRQDGTVDNGIVRSLRATVIPINEEDGTRVAVVLSDVTDLRRAERQQGALAYLGQRALTTLDVPSLLNESVELVATTLGVERCDLVECIELAAAGGRVPRRGAFDPARDEQLQAGSPRAVPRDGAGGGEVHHSPSAATGEVYAHVRTCYGRRGGAWAAGAVSAAPGSYVWKVLSSCQPLDVDDLAEHPEILPEGWLHGDGAVATVGAPIGVGARAFGVLAAHSTSRRRFSRDERHFVQSVANVIAAAVELAQMQEDRARLAVFEDRDRIACELHDLVIQRLFSVGLRLQSLVRLVPEPGAVRLSTAISDLDQTIDEVRRTIFDLRPPYA